MDKVLRAKLKSITADELNGVKYKRTDYVRSIINYPAMMVPSVQEPIIRAFSDELSDDKSLFDPFMGAANTLVTGMKLGFNVYGQDINPLAVLIAKVKTTTYSQRSLLSAYDILLEEVNSDRSNRVEIEYDKIDKWFTPEIQIELSKIRRAIISTVSQMKVRRLLWVNLAETVRLCSNDRTSTFKMHCRSADDISKRRISAKDLFFKNLKSTINAISDFNYLLEKQDQLTKRSFNKEVKVYWRDSKIKIPTLNKFDLVVTSPPYGDNQTTVTYGQYSFLPLLWIPKTDIDKSYIYQYLESTQAIDSKSLGGHAIRDFHLKKENLYNKSKTFKKVYSKIEKESSTKFKKIVNFWSDFDLVIDKIAESLTPDGHSIWTIGNRRVNNTIIPNNKILIDLMEIRGCELEMKLKRKILNKRMPSKNNFSKTMRTEQILIFGNDR